jgi:hypothetical protein
MSRAAHAVGSKAVVRTESKAVVQHLAWAALWNSPCASDNNKFTSSSLPEKTQEPCITNIQHTT